MVEESMNNESRVTLLVEGYPRYGFQTFAKLVQSGYKGVCITRLHPEYVAEKYDLKNAHCYWLSGKKGKEVITPKALSHLSKTIKSEAVKGPGVLVLLEGLEYLLLWNDMNKIIEVLKDLNGLLSKTNADIVIPVDPLTLEQRDLERLWAAFPRYEPKEILAAMATRQPQQISAVLLESAGQTISDLSGSVELRATP